MNDSGLVSGSVLFAVLSSLGCLALFVDRAQRPTLRCQMGLFLGAFALRFALAILIDQSRLASVLRAEDSAQWVKGVTRYQSWVAQGLGLRQLLQVVAELCFKDRQGYYFLLGALFLVTGPAPLPAAVFNGFLGALTVVLVFRLAATLFSRPVAFRVGWWLCLFPSMVIWSAQTIKEPVVLFLEVYAIYALIIYRNASRPLQGILLSIASALALTLFRFYAACVVFTAVLAGSVVPLFWRRRLAHGPSPGALAAIALLVAAGAIGVTMRSYNYLKDVDFEYFLWLRSYFNRGGSGVPTDYDMHTWGGFACGFLMGVAHLLLAPFPWQLVGGSLRMQLTAPEMIVWWYLFFAGVLPGLWYVLRDRWADLIPILVLVLIQIALHGLIFGNIGYAFRQRSHLLPWLLMFAAVGLERARIPRAGKPLKL